MIKTKIILIILGIVIFILIALNVHYLHKWNQKKEFEKKNEEIQMPLTNEVSKAERLFQLNEKDFQRIVNDTKNLQTTLVYNDLVIHITTKKDNIIFSLFNDCIKGCFISINLVFTKTNKFESTDDIIKLKDNWYLQKEVHWGT
jgi:hypothetical protein